MAIQTGRWNFGDGEPLPPPGILWEGRLDNAAELAEEVGLPTNRSGDALTIVSECYRRWETQMFPKLIGDWAVVIWDSRSRSLLLAKDYVGLRPLYYSFSTRSLGWSGSLDLLLSSSIQTPSLDLEYLAGWLSLFPRADATPYAGIRAVPPAAFVRFQPRHMAVHNYWNFDSRKVSQPRIESDYEEQFRWHFTNAVRRRLRSPRPVLAELSGGMDSSSIVCVADRLLDDNTGLTPRLDTISYFDDSEPDWNERPYFSAVERQRGRQGHHVPVDAREKLQALLNQTESTATPAECGSRANPNTGLSQLIAVQSYGVILSGIGGDEFTGGIPTAIPELADLMAAFHFITFHRQAMAWALSQRRPWIHLSLETLRAFAPSALDRNGSRRQPPAWVQLQFASSYREAFQGYEGRLTLSGPPPSFQENLCTLNALRRQIASTNVFPTHDCEKRFPYLDRDLLEFLFAVPRQHIIKPGRRRFLMRQSLARIVPQEILDRKRKAYVTQSPRIALAALWPDVLKLTTNMLSEALGIVHSTDFRQSLEDIRDGKAGAIVPLFRTLTLERWLRNLQTRGVVSTLNSSAETNVGLSPLPSTVCGAVSKRSSAS